MAARVHRRRSPLNFFAGDVPLLKLYYTANSVVEHVDIVGIGSVFTFDCLLLESVLPIRMLRLPSVWPI